MIVSHDLKLVGITSQWKIALNNFARQADSSIPPYFRCSYVKLSMDPLLLFGSIFINVCSSLVSTCVHNFESMEVSLYERYESTL